jgi:hypothetical protein
VQLIGYLDPELQNSTFPKPKKDGSVNKSIGTWDISTNLNQEERD